ncbi:zonadhesin-like isoform X2 [Saccoglossus kowalevskii]
MWQVTIIFAVTIVRVCSETIRELDNSNMHYYNRKGFQVQSVACDPGDMTLQCDDRSIRVIAANFGRTDEKMCNTSRKPGDLNCRGANSLSIVRSLCERKEKCVIGVNTDVFGDACHDTAKYLDVTYTCWGGGDADPDMVTFDGRQYQFTGTCKTYVLVNDCARKTFEITADFQTKNTSAAEPSTKMIGITIKAKTIPALHLQEDNSYWIGGKLYNDTVTILGHDMVSIRKEGKHLVVHIKKPKISVIWNGKPNKVMVSLSDTQLTGSICGMLGNADGNPKNDFIKTDKTRTSDAAEFGDSWAVPGSCSTVKEL